jgi:transcription initiation factor TFIIIB Brf1 subunit/transcription initiation factor TFIIB
VYVASILVDRNPYTQKEVAELSGVTEVTIRNRKKDFEEFFPTKFI